MNTAVAPAALLELINAGWTTQALAAACELGLPDRLAHGARPARDLARDLGVEVDALQRLLHALVTLEVCRDDGAGAFALGPLGAWLSADVPGGLYHWARLNGGTLWTPWGTLSDRVRGAPSGTRDDRSTARFKVLENDAAESRLFHRAMVELTARMAPSLARAVGPVGEACVVDVGGGAGELLATVLAQHPAARGLLFDLPSALAHADELLVRHGVRSRCTLQGGSFFDAWPSEGGVYLLKSVLHDWDDAHARRLLRRAREVLHGAKRLVLIERLRADCPGPTVTDRATARADLNMLVALSGRERRQEEFAALLAEAQLTLHEVHAVDGGMSALEVHAARPRQPQSGWPTVGPSGREAMS